MSGFQKLHLDNRSDLNHPIHLHGRIFALYEGETPMISEPERRCFMFCASVAYPIQRGGTFDFDYFANKHVPLFARFLGDNCVRFEVHKSLASPGAPAPNFHGVAYFWVKSGEDFGAALAQYGKEIYSDIPHFTDIEPIRQWSEVVQTEASS